MGLKIELFNDLIFAILNSNCNFNSLEFGEIQIRFYPAHRALRASA